MFGRERHREASPAVFGRGGYEKNGANWKAKSQHEPPCGKLDETLGRRRSARSLKSAKLLRTRKTSPKISVTPPNDRVSIRRSKSCRSTISVRPNPDSLFDPNADTSQTPPASPSPWPQNSRRQKVSDLAGATAVCCLDGLDRPEKNDPCEDPKWGDRHQRRFRPGSRSCFSCTLITSHRAVQRAPHRLSEYT